MKNYCTNQLIANCEYDKVENNPSVYSDQSVRCFACFGKFAGDATIVVDTGEAKIAAGRCLKWGVEAETATTRPTEQAA